ncbi:Telomere repeat-binding factor 5 [Bienertia sinuspersici]
MKIRKTSCLKCLKLHEALVCSNQDCPIVVHESCMPCLAHFDGTGSFYCPYCLYKQSLVECHQAKEKAFLKRKKPEAPTIVKRRNGSGCLKVDCNKAHQPMQMVGGQQDDSQFLSGDQQQVWQTKVQCLGKGFVAKNDGDLTKSCRVSVKKVEGYMSGKQEDAQTQASLRTEDSTKEIHEKTVNKGRDIGITYESTLKSRSPKTDPFVSRMDTALVTRTSKHSSNENEETVKKVEGFHGGWVEREQTQTDPQETPWCLTNKNILEISKEANKRKEFQDYCFVRTQLVEYFDQAAENGEDCIARTDEEERKEKNVVRAMRNDGELLPSGESGRLSIKDPETEQEVEKFHNEVMEKVQMHEEPNQISAFCTREDNVNVISDIPEAINDSAYQDDYSIVRQMMVKPGNAIRFSRVAEDLCQRTDERWTNFKLAIKDAYPTREYNESEKHENSRNSIKGGKENSKPVEFYNGLVEEVQMREESQESYVCFPEKTATAVNKELKEIKDSGSRDDYFPRSGRIVNSVNADQPDHIGKNGYARKTLQRPVHPTRVDNAAVTHQSGNFTKQHPETKYKLEGYHNGVADIEQTQTEIRSTRDDEKQEMVEESDAENCNSFQDECFLKREIAMCRMDADQLAFTRDSRRMIEGKTWVKTVKYAPQITRNERASVSYEDFGCPDDSESCTRNSDYQSYEIHAMEKRQTKKNLKNGLQLEESSGCSENEVDEAKICTHDKPRHKFICSKQSTVLPAARRRKLPWTTQEIEMLKEGVQKFSLTANKNLPWMRILEFGRHIFDGTRTPADLKDKWKNMKGKGNTIYDTRNACFRYHRMFYLATR